MTVNPDTCHKPGAGIYDVWLDPDSVENLPAYLTGSYILLVYLAEKRVIEIGKLADISFPKGYYAYVGSAMRGIKTRLRRHFTSGKNCHWHIDHLLERAHATGAFVLPEETKSECIYACILNSRFVSFRGFGSSDCRCSSHLFYSSDERRLKYSIREVVQLSLSIHV